MNVPEIDWAKLIGLILGGIGTGLGIYNTWAARQAMKPKLKISWLNCRQAYRTFSKWAVDQGKQAMLGSHPEGIELDPVTSHILETLPRWTGSLKERFVQADIVFHNEGGRDIVISDIQIDDWVGGRGPYASVMDWPTGPRFRAIDPRTGQEVDLSATVTIPPRRSVTRRIEIYEKRRSGPGAVGRTHFPVPGPEDYLLLRVVTDSQPPLIVKRIPLKEVVELSRPEWTYDELERARLTVYSPIIVRGSLPVVRSLICKIAAEDGDYDVVFQPPGASDGNTSGAHVRFLGEIYYTPRREPLRRDKIGQIDLHQLPEETCYLSLNPQGSEQHRDSLESFGWLVSWQLKKLGLVQRLV